MQGVECWHPKLASPEMRHVLLTVMDPEDVMLGFISYDS